MKLLNTVEAIKKYGGKSSRQAARIAKKLDREGKIYPQKVGRDWVAPVEVWQYILLQKDQDKYPENLPIYELMNTVAGGKRNGKSGSWAKQLAKREYELSKLWPQKVGREWIAPAEFWDRLFQDAGKVGRPKKTNNKKKSK